MKLRMGKKRCLGMRDEGQFGYSVIYIYDV